MVRSVPREQSPVLGGVVARGEAGGTDTVAVITRWYAVVPLQETALRKEDVISKPCFSAAVVRTRPSNPPACTALLVPAKSERVATVNGERFERGPDPLTSMGGDARTQRSRSKSVGGGNARGIAIIR